MSLCKPHPIIRTAGSSPYEVTKAGIQALFLSGRYRTETLCSHWSSNPGGYCLCPSCTDKHIPEDEEHIFLHCGSLSNTRHSLAQFTVAYSKKVPHLSNILLTFTSPSHPLFVQFMLDCSVIPDVISLAQEHGDGVLSDLFKVTRAWCYSLHRERLKILGRWLKWSTCPPYYIPTHSIRFPWVPSKNYPL